MPMQLTDTVIAQLLIPCFMETKGRNCRGYRNVFNPSNKKPSSPGVPTRLKIARIILNQQPTASRLLHHMIAKLLESNGWFQHEVFIWPKSDCSYLICFRKKNTFLTTYHHTSPKISSCSNCSEFCKNDLQHKRCSIDGSKPPPCRELSYPNQWKLDMHFPKFPYRWDMFSFKKGIGCIGFLIHQINHVSSEIKS